MELGYSFLYIVPKFKQSFSNIALTFRNIAASNLRSLMRFCWNFKGNATTMH